MWAFHEEEGADIVSASEVKANARSNHTGASALRNLAGSDSSTANMFLAAANVLVRGDGIPPFPVTGDSIPVANGEPTSVDDNLVANTDFDSTYR